MLSVPKKHALEIFVPRTNRTFYRANSPGQRTAPQDKRPEDRTLSFKDERSSRLKPKDWSTSKPQTGCSYHLQLKMSPGPNSPPKPRGADCDQQRPKKKRSLKMLRSSPSLSEIPKHFKRALLRMNGSSNELETHTQTSSLLDEHRRKSFQVRKWCLLNWLLEQDEQKFKNELILLEWIATAHATFCRLSETTQMQELRVISEDRFKSLKKQSKCRTLNIELLSKKWR
jgi:hypothetical protein